VHAPRRMSEPAGLGNGDERAQMAELHHAI
jgi:hypothetical protein